MNAVLRTLKNVKVMNFDIANGNGRIYLYDSVDINNLVLTEMIEQKMLLGELGFPEDGRAETDIRKVSHAITALRKESDGLYADIDILNTPNGRILNKYVNENNFRTRGSGIVKQDGTVVSYTFFGIDYTDNPA